MDQSEIESKIRKLLALSESDNPHEAANAAARAQRLITKYKIEKLNESGEDFAIPEVEQQTRWPFFTYRTKKPSYWRWRIASAIARANNCQPWYGQVGDVRMCFCIGGAEDAAHAQAIYKYIEPLVVGMRDRGRPFHVRGGRKRSWNHAFETGASAAIADRIEQQIRSDRVQLEQEESVALQRISEMENAVSRYMQSRGMGFTRRQRNARVDEQAYRKGRTAGKSINLGNNNQKALKGR